MSIRRKLHRILSLLMLVHVAVFFISGFILLALKDDFPEKSKRLTAASLEAVLLENELQIPGKAPVLILRNNNEVSIRMNTKKNPTLKGASKHKFSVCYYFLLLSQVSRERCYT